MSINWRPDEQWLADFYARTGKKPEAQPVPQAIKEPQKLIRQASKDSRNKTEKAYDNEVLKWRKIRGEIKDYKPHAIRLQLCNGQTYTPDYYVQDEHGISFHEVKGEKRNGKVVARDDAISKIKFAPKEFPAFRFFLVWKGSNGEWLEQEVKEVESC